MASRFLLAALISGRLSLAAASWELPLFTAPPQAVLDAAGKIAAPPGADVAAIDLNVVMHLDAEGRLRWIQRSVSRVLTAAGVGQLSTVTAAWAPWRQNKPRIQVRVISPDGAAHLLSDAAITEAGIPAQLMAGIFSDRKLLRAPMPAIQAGAVVEMEIEREDREVLFPGGQFMQFPLGAPGPIQHVRVVVEGPPGIQAVAQGFPARCSEETAGAVHRIILEADGLPAPRRIVLAPPEAVPGPAISLAAGATWQSVAAWYAAIVDSKIGALPAQPPLAATQISRARLAEILASLHKRVRYTGLELGMSEYVPHSPAETLDRGYGDCKDKAVVLAGELRQLGFPADLALLRPYPAPEVSLALAGIEAFSHAIVYLRGTPPLWIDPTAETVPAGRLPAMDEGRQALIVDSRTTGLILTPESSPGDNRSIEEQEIEILPDGGARIKRSFELWGSSAALLRLLFAIPTATEEFRKRLFAGTTGSAEAKLEFDPPDHPADPYHWIFASGANGGTGVKREWAWADVMPLALEPGLLTQLLQETGPSAGAAAQPGSPRNEDYYFPAAFALVRSTRIAGPRGFRALLLPKPETVSLGPVTFERFVSLDVGDRMLVHQILRSPRRRYTAAEGRAITDGLRKLIAAGGLRIQFRRAAER